MINKIINKYKDNTGFYTNLDTLVLELKHNKISEEKILELISELESNNKETLELLKKENISKERKLKDIAEIKCIEKNYIKQEKIEKVIKTEISNTVNIKFYIELFDENIDNIYLFLPKSNDKESLNIIDLIIIFYLKEMTFYRNYLILAENIKEQNSITEYLSLLEIKINLIKKYKSELLLETKEEIDTNKNVISFFCNTKNIPYVINDIKIDSNNYIVMCNLIDSIVKGTFKNIKPFTNNDSLKGIYEVRDLKNKTRVFFTIENQEYCIFYAIEDKSETNSIYKKKLLNRYKLFKENKTFVSKLDYEKLIKN